MHDTCATANAVPHKIAMFKEESGKSHYGEDGWAQQSDDVRKMLDHLCANHTRNLPVNALNRLFKAYLLKELGSDFESCQKASGSRARLEKDGEQFLRAICKLVHKGHGEYAKGDGQEIFD